MDDKPADRIKMAVLFPLLAVLVIAVYAGGLGVLFMVLESTPMGTWLVVIVGLSLVILVPTVAAIAEHRSESR